MSHARVLGSLWLWTLASVAHATGSESCPYAPSADLGGWIGEVEEALGVAPAEAGQGPAAVAEEAGSNAAAGGAGSSVGGRSAGGGGSGGGGSSLGSGSTLPSAAGAATAAASACQDTPGAAGLSPEEQAALATIRYAEGADYHVLFGYHQDSSRTIDPYSQVGHPDSVYSTNGYSSAAAGAYQAMPDTWNEEVAKGTITSDFTPANQDRFALARLAYRGLLDEVRAGDTSWITSLEMGREWASFPNSPYGQPMKSASELRGVYEEALACYRR